MNEFGQIAIWLGVAVVCAALVSGGFYLRFKGRILTQMALTVMPGAVAASTAGFIVGLRKMDLTTLFVVLPVACVVVFAAILIAARKMAQRLDQLSSASQRIASGDLESDVTAHGTDEIAHLAAALQQLQLQGRAQCDAILAISNGDMQTPVPVRSDKDAQAIALEQMQRNIRRMLKDTHALVASARSGKLHHRVNAETHQGEYRDIILGFNRTLDAITEPLNQAITLMQSVAEGQLPAEVNTDCHGAYRILMQSIEQCVIAVRGLTDDMSKVIAAQKKGQLCTRCAVTQQGVYAEIANGMNDVLDTVISPMSRGTELLALYAQGNLASQMPPLPGDLQQFAVAVNQIRANILSVVAELASLADAAVAGELSCRADSKKYRGDYQKVVSGINDTLDATIRPLLEAASVLQRLAQRDLTARMTGDYKGGHAEIRETMNDAVNSLASAMTAIQKNSEVMTRTADVVGVTGDAQVAFVESVDRLLSSSASSSAGMALEMETDNTRMATIGELSRENMRLAQSGSDLVTQTKGAVDGIHQSATQMVAFIGVINDIASQTNLLALNASVEAARAGDAGVGFAVVASEIRNLAERSRNAASEVEQLIQKSLRLSNQGDTLASRTADGFGEIASGIKDITELIEQMTSATGQRMNEVKQLGERLQSADRQMKQAVADAKQSTFLSKNLQQTAQAMKEQATSFKTES